MRDHLMRLTVTVIAVAYVVVCALVAVCLADAPLVTDYQLPTLETP